MTGPLDSDDDRAEQFPRPRLRASDADRERIATRLRHAAGEGRLFTDELEERLAAVLSARTYGELDRLVADLPAPEPPAVPELPSAALTRQRERSSLRRTLLLAMVFLIAVLLMVGALGASLHSQPMSVNPSGNPPGLSGP